MSALRNYLNKIKPNFQEGGKLHAFESVFDGFESFLYVPNTTAKSGAHIHDAIDSKRIMSFVVIALIPALLFGKKKEYNLDARIKGGERHMIMSGEYDQVLPMDIFGEYLIKAIITGDIDKQEQLGIYEVSPEDFAVAEFVDSSKLELQKIVRDGLNTLRKENA